LRLQILKIWNGGGCDVRGDQAVRADQGQALFLVMHDSARCIYVYRHGGVAPRIIIGVRATA